MSFAEDRFKEILCNSSTMDILGVSKLELICGQYSMLQTIRRLLEYQLSAMVPNLNQAQVIGLMGIDNQMLLSYTLTDLQLYQLNEDALRSAVDYIQSISLEEFANRSEDIVDELLYTLRIEPVKGLHSNYESYQDYLEVLKNTEA